MSSTANELNVDGMQDPEIRCHEDAANEPRFPVVGIGASAGGLAAFSRLLAKLPPTTGMAFVLIQHLDPHHESHLARILAKDATMPVVEAAAGMMLEIDHVYVIPPNTLMGIEHGRLLLHPREAVRGPHLSIDYFFRSLARSCESQAICVLLTGTGSDGTLGMAEIKASGGITFAQEPKTAEEPEMPRSAIAYGCVDFILSEQEIAHEIGVISRHPYLKSHAGAQEEDPFSGEPQAYERIIQILKDAHGVDFGNYRPSTIKRRILRRMAMRSHAVLAEYVAMLTSSADEIDLLLKDVLINVTNFFRDEEVFATIRTRVFPELVANRGADMAIRIWVAGCSTGQEAYSLAIELIEFLDDKPARPLIQIFATDISEPSLLKARSGIYLDTIQAEVSPERLRRHFTKVTEGYRINKSIRDMCVFAKHDVLSDTPFSKIDLVSCRNMLIYLSPTLQMRVIPTFHYALNLPGFLVLGSSETTGRASDLFSVVDQRQRIYAKNRVAGRLHPPPAPAPVNREAAVAGARPAPVTGTSGSLADYQRAADRLVLGRYAPAGVLIDADLNIIQFRGSISGFIDHSQGEASLNLLKMAPYGLAQELKEAVEEARRRNAGVERLGIRYRNREGLREIDLRITPIRPLGGQDGCVLVLFENHVVKPTQEAPPIVPEAEITDLAKLRQELAAVRQELTTANEHLQALSDENTVVTDELKFANDESHSSNEELRCSNEELQTAKEEVESANEELATLNEELRNRNFDLTLLSNDLTNLLDSIELPVVMLGGDLKLRRLTVAAEKSLHLVSTDIGRPISGLNLVFDGPDLAQLVTEVIAARQAKALEIRDRQGHWYNLRISPYRTESDEITGAVVTLIDIDVVKGTQEGLKRTAEFSQAILETVRDPLLVLDHQLRVETANRAFCRLFDLPREDVVGKHIHELNDGKWDIPELRRLLEDISTTGAQLDNFEVSQDFPGMGQRILLLNARCLENDCADSHMIVMSIADITEQKRITNDLRATATELLRSNAELDHFAAVASHDLQEPMRMISSFAGLLKRKYASALDATGLEYLGFVSSGAKRMQEMIRAILDYSRAGHQEIRIERVELSACVRAATLNLDRAITKAKAVIKCDPPMPIIASDPQQMTQLFQNLLANALKFRSPDRPCVVVVNCRESEREWTCSVADNGIGIRPEDFGRIFNLFQRLHAPSEYPGTGIGLATCKKIIERHHGRMWLESTLGVGTTFHISLPKQDMPS